MGCGSSKGVNSVVVPSAQEVIVKDHTFVKPLKSEPEPLTVITRGTESSRSTFSKENSSAASSCLDVPVYSSDCAQATQKDQSKPQFGSSQRMFASTPMFGSQRAFGENGKLFDVDTRQR
jgi:type IV secretory pathway VirB9-like protein